ncbi:MAG: 4-nitrophenylphosphatase [Holdemanella sp.]|nr:4-nitrophenylphosphatase [Holdemanella sp.]
MKTLIFDLDGTMYRDTSIIESAKRFLDYCIEKKIPFIFMTNNAMRTQKENAKHMLTMGYEGIEPWMFYNSAMASCQYVKSISDKRKAYYIGRDGMKMALMDEGFLITEDKPDFVFVGLDKECTYASYSKALSFLLDGATLIGTNKDRVLVKQGGFEVGNGSVVALFEYASNQKSPDIAKPAYPILDLCMKHFHLKKEDISKRDEDSERLILTLAEIKRKDIISRYKELGVNINPLVLVQIPNTEDGEAKKMVVKDFLRAYKITEDNGKLKQ